MDGQSATVEVDLTAASADGGDQNRPQPTEGAEPATAPLGAKAESELKSQGTALQPADRRKTMRQK